MNIALGEKNRNLTDYLKEIKILRGIVPICSFCKKIRDQEGHWTNLEEYISGHSEAAFSHCIWDECKAKRYPAEIKDA